MARLQGTESRLADCFSAGLAKLHSKLEAELDKVLEQEELIWFQRAREKWVQFGEKNTSYFHQQANIRRRRNKIEALRDDNDNWVTDPHTLASLVFNFFANLCMQDTSSYEDRLPKNSFPHISQEDMLTLLRPFTISDVHKAIFDMKPFQAPGPDGYQAVFYQELWKFVGKSLTDMVIKFFETGSLPEKVSESTLVLIPKVEKPEMVSQLRPISLNNVSLKTITKALTSRLKPLMRKLVSPRQNSFIPGRQTTDNVIVVQEVLHSLHKRRGKKGGLVLKIDLEKAYDRLRWDFLRDTLKEVGLPSTWISGIMHCVEQNRMRILWNGQLSQPIAPTRGVRQGDPLSPYLFVLCMERLSHLIDELVANGHWKAIRLSSNDPPLTHLFFADDLLLFAEAETRQVRVIKRCLDDFCASSGQIVNYQKSILYVSPNIGQPKANRLSQLAGIPLKANLGKYLGIPAIHGRVTKDRYHSLLLRIQKKLAPWKAKRLSFAARLNVAKSVSASIPVYNMNTELIPIGVYNSIDKVNRDFVWGDEENKSKLHLVAWDKMTQPKCQGGVGLRPTRQANLAMLAKGGWRLINEKDNLWGQVMLSKYGRQRENLDILRHTQGSSFTWSSFTKAADLLKKDSAWNIKNGKSTKFWFDPWVLQVALKDVALNQIPEELEHAVVGDFVTSDGSWRTDLFSEILPVDIVQKILSVAVDTLSTEEDTLFWHTAPDGRFSTKSAYTLINQHQADPNEKLWKTIWQLPVPERVRSFVWLVCRGRIPTNSFRFSRKIAPNPSCQRCTGAPESILHLLRDCPPALFFWTRHVPSARQFSFFSTGQEDWLRSNLLSTDSLESGVTWAAFFSTSIWLLWKNRCTYCLQGPGAALSPPSLEHSIITRIKLWHAAWIAPPSLPSSRTRPANMVMADIGWTPPAAGWCALNVDGASNGNPGPAGTGGVLRDSTGQWIAGYMANIGSTTAAHAELWALMYGLDLAWKHDCRALQVQTDSQLALQLINSRHDPVHPYATLLTAIRRKISRDWLVRLTHTYREGNRVADWLSKHSLVYPYGMHELGHPPPGVVSILREDVMGVTRPRRVTAHSPPSVPSPM
ncbi:unnamed protein product [Linum trigynum]|uniref:Reverse transcriptase domain-containing protein n=1 Tax=Linum trigynum TaxID=586398 RepID=A0AAV2GA21_9ROSI